MEVIINFQASLSSLAAPRSIAFSALDGPFICDKFRTQVPFSELLQRYNMFTEALLLIIKILLSVPQGLRMTPTNTGVRLLNMRDVKLKSSAQICQADSIQVSRRFTLWSRASYLLPFYLLIVATTVRQKRDRRRLITCYKL